MRTLFLLLMAFGAHAAQFTVAWDATPSTATYELRLSWPGNSVTTSTAGLSWTFTNLINGTQYQINATAISSQGVRSDPSTNFFVPVPGQPGNLRVSMLFESAPELPGPWTTQSNIVFYTPPVSTSQFYRARMLIARQ